jgi:endonuclease YncB( thermonuclease family)
MKMRAVIFLFALFLFSCSNNNQQESNANSTSGKVIAIIDGDTYDILLDGNKTVRIRMEGIDAPEKGMPFYRVAKKYLGELCFEKNVRLEIHDTDSRGRKIAFTYLDDGTEISHEMIKAGLAWHFTKYNKDEDLATLEVQARESKLGLWTDESPMPPWDNRSLHRNGISTKDSFDIKEGQQ